MSKTFSHAGVSRGLNGEFKVRFANSALRTKVLIKTGQKDIDLMELKHPMTKEEAVDFMLSIDFDNGNKEVRAALENEQVKRSINVKAPKARAVKAAPTMESIKAKVAAKKAAPKSTVTKAEIAAQLADMEDAPF